MLTLIPAGVERENCPGEASNLGGAQLQSCLFAPKFSIFFTRENGKDPSKPSAHPIPPDNFRLGEVVRYSGNLP